jgi:hypothetical protein
MTPFKRSLIIFACFEDSVPFFLATFAVTSPKAE